MDIKLLRAFVKLPFARPDGTTVTCPGYDIATGIFADFEPDSVPPLPVAPTRSEIVAAVRTLWLPWSQFPFATAADRSGMLAAVLTAVCRPALDTAPAFMFEAPTQGSGKTLAASALAALVRGTRGGVTPFVGGRNADEELSKQFVSMLMAGESFLLVDNVVGTWRSSVLASVITDAAIRARILGGNSWFCGDVRLMITATSNNASLDADLVRRFIRIRIDAREETPHARQFDFDPVDVVLRDRLAIARAALVLVRAYQAAGAPRIARGSAGFQQWTDCVRNVIMWLAETGVLVDAGCGAAGDPAMTIMDQSAATCDPDTVALSSLLQGVFATRGGAPFSSRDLYRDYEGAAGGAAPESLQMIRDGVLGMFPDNHKINAFAIGRRLAGSKGRILGGLLLQPAGRDAANSQLWRVEIAPSRRSGDAGDVCVSASKTGSS